MTFIDDYLAEVRDSRDENTKADLYTSLYLDGADAAAFGRLPEYADPVYLEGYCNKLKELPKDPETGKLQHYSPRQHFAFGYIDGAEKFYTGHDEF
ncbi:hypothetical protein C7B82_05830 [Stenomitos frigidus ULC18]|uniref:Uncharacterized protein n=2 Tax=Stenomitos TaxID=1844270 RepID=A0A2T1EHU4_9CYAN|nr:hypothetical protein C7B82_05830 [Stenomitos frigidus ULC18]